MQIRVPSPQELRRPRSAAQVMSETTAFFAANPSEALRFGFEPMPQIMMPAPGHVEAPRRTPGGRLSRAQYANAEARKTVLVRGAGPHSRLVVRLLALLSSALLPGA